MGIYTKSPQRQAQEARQAREAQAKAYEEQRRLEAERRAQESVQKPVEVAPVETPKVEEKPAETDEITYTMTFSIEGDHDSVKELCDLLRRLKADGGLTFKVLEKGQK